MKAEEKLEEHRHVVTVLNPDWTWCKENQNHIVDSCEAYDIGKEAIALLRDCQPYLHHKLDCARPRFPECDCGLQRMRDKCAKFLDGDGERRTVNACSGSNTYHLPACGGTCEEQDLDGE